MSDVIDVFFASDRAYYSGLFVALESCVVNCSQPLRFTVVMNEADPRTARCFDKLTARENVLEIRVILLSDLDGIDNYKGRAHFSKMAFARLLMGEIYSSSEAVRVLYLDPDIIVHVDVAELWNLGGDNPLMMSNENNSGVLLMDLDYWRSEGMDQHCIDIWKRDGQEFKHPDQDLLIQEFNEKGLCGHFDYHKWNLGSGHWDGVSACVIHCIGGRKPWHEDYQYAKVTTLFDRYYTDIFGDTRGLRQGALASSFARRWNNFKIKLGLK